MSSFLFFVRKHLLLFSLILYGLGLHGQSCEEQFFGVVLDLHDDSPLEQVKVTVVETNQQLLTNAEGKFLFLGLCKGQYTLLFEHPDCVSVSQKQSLPVVSLKRFYLEHHINELEEIIVSEVGQKKNSKASIESRLNEEEIKRFSSQILVDDMAALSGVSILKKGNAIVKPMVHGLTGSFGHSQRRDSPTRP